jgi:5-deoxy-glucuronate isomerase
MSKHHFAAGSAHEAPFPVNISPELAGWTFCGLRVLELAAGESHQFQTHEDEMLVLPLRGSCSVRVDEHSFTLAGRDSVFAQVSDFAYVPRNSQVEVRSETGGCFAMPAARARRRLEPAYGAASGVAVELRGAGQASRQVNNICTPETFDADRLIVVEVLTPGGNWSSYPPHKHDEHRPGEEILEEIYYFEINGPAGVGYQRVYTSGPGREIDVSVEVRSQDVVLVPFGYHGPSMAAPGYDMYYLNVMAGPGEERAWRFCDDPAHAWIRTTWSGQQVDPRLPLTLVDAKEGSV